MALRIPLGISSFRRLREDGMVYVDKTHLIRDLIDGRRSASLRTTSETSLVVLPRPRRFGQTTNLSMLRSYFEKSSQPLWPLFAGLDIDRAAQAHPAYRAHFQRYPVISLSFKDVRGTSWEQCRGGFAQVLAAAVAEHRYLLDSGTLAPDEIRQFHAILGADADDALLSSALLGLSAWLERHHRERVLDEYDTPKWDGCSWCAWR